MEYTPEGRSVERSILQGASSGAERSILHKMPERSEFRSAPAFFTIFEYPKFFGHHRRPKSTPKNFSAPSAAEKYPKNFRPPSAAEKYPPKFFFHCRSGRSGAGYTPEKKYSPERGAEYTPVGGAQSGANSGKIRSVQSLLHTILGLHIAR